MVRLRLIFIIITICLVSYAYPGNAKRTKPLVWDMSELSLMKQEGVNNHEVALVLKQANEVCKRSSISVVYKSKSFAPDNHYYCSVGPYWWPNPEGGDKYINRDGIVNPESKNYDSEKLVELRNNLKLLSQAFYFTKQKQYYNAFVEQLTIWFLDSSTRMYPTFAYAQVIPGHNNNMGRSTGMIDAYSFNTIIESIRLVNCTKRIKRKTMLALKDWFHQFALDSEERYGDVFREADNNISLAYDVTMANLLLFSEDFSRAREIIDGFYERRICKQINEVGQQPAELSRTKAFTYSLYNLSHILDFCVLVKSIYPNYFNDYGERIEIAFAFLSQYIEDPQIFPYQQITDWKECIREYNEQSYRVRKLQNQ